LLSDSSLWPSGVVMAMLEPPITGLDAVPTAFA
jgi:hypothetical protein